MIGKSTLSSFGVTLQKSSPASRSASGSVFIFKTPDPDLHEMDADPKTPVAGSEALALSCWFWIEWYHHGSGSLTY